MSQQMKDINKPMKIAFKKKTNWNSGVKKYSKWNKKFFRRVQHILAGKKYIKGLESIDQ